MHVPIPNPARSCEQCQDTLRPHEDGPLCPQCQKWLRRGERIEAMARAVKKPAE